MFKITDYTKPSFTVDSHGILNGTTFKGKIGLHEGVFQKIDNHQIVQLDNLANRWHCSNSITVYNYLEVDVELIVTNKK